MSTSNPSSSTWKLRFQQPPDNPNLAKFSETINWASFGQKEWLMYNQTEELLEEESEEVVKDEEYYRKRRKQRRYYRRKQTISLESDDTENKLMYQGRLINLDFNEAVTDAKSSTNNHTNNDKETPFQYVLLQFVKRKEGTTESAEINVIPVNDMFAFRKTGEIKDELLDDIDEKFKQEQERKHQYITRFKDISRALQRSQQKKGNVESQENLDENENEIVNGNPFGTALSKVFTRMNEKEEEEKNKKKRRSKQVLDGNEDGSLFKPSVTSIFDLGSGSSSSGGKRSKKEKGGAESVDDFESQGKIFLNENGVDMEELQQTNWGSNEFGVRFADDEEEQVDLEQQQVTSKVESEMSSAWRYDEVVSDEEDDQEDEDDEAGEKNAEDGDGGVKASGGTRSTAVSIGDRMSMVDENMLISAQLATKALLAQQKQQQHLQKQAKNINSNSDVKSALKRGRDEDLPAESSQENKKVKFRGEETASNREEVMDTLPADSADSLATTTPEYTLSEKSVRKYILSRGGKVSSKDFKKFFKPIVKEYPAGAKLGAERLVKIVNDITNMTEDTILGQCIVLKDEYK